MPDHAYIYEQQAELYERLVSRQPGLLDIVNGIRPVEGLDIVDAGAGTGRLAAALAPYARTLTALDASAPMLEVTARKLLQLGLPRERWSCIPADHRCLPLPDSSADLLVSGWSVCYLASSGVPDWRGNLEVVMAEFRRVVRPGGSIILFETMGTGTDEPSPPSFLTGYYRLLQEEYGFSHKTIRLDYTFPDWQEAEHCVRSFFGDEPGDRIRQERSHVLKEYAGVWWLTGLQP
jgi:ubiquinone/menaquinone biosynthesis C-methylase UbiE